MEETDELEELTRRALQQMSEMPQQKQTPDAPKEERKPLPPLPRQQDHSLLRFLRLDSDALLILPLVLLLGREGADSGLLLALLYIML
jgi:hypothetical protein